jgi:hypothetical protein
VKRAAILLAIAGCASTASPAPVRRTSFAAQVASASGPDLLGMLHTPLGYGGLWFDDHVCNAEFIAPGMIGDDRIYEFARCLATLHLTPSARKSPFPDVIVFDYPPGFEVEAEFQVRGMTTIRWIGYAGRHDFRDALPAVTPGALGAPALSLSADDSARLAHERADLHIDRSQAWLKVCIDADGHVTGAHPREESSPIAGDVFSAAAMQWKLRPFVVDGRAIPVCSLVMMTDPAGGDPTMLPHPIPADMGAVMVDARVLHRIVGDAQIHPDENTMVEIAKAGGGILYASFAYCIDEGGSVMAVRALRKTGVERYDDEIADAMRGWKYRPFVVDRKATPACAAITFIYSVNGI